MFTLNNILSTRKQTQDKSNILQNYINKTDRTHTKSSYCRIWPDVNESYATSTPYTESNKRRQTAEEDWVPTQFTFPVISHNERKQYLCMLSFNTLHIYISVTFCYRFILFKRRGCCFITVGLSFTCYLITTEQFARKS